MKYFKKTEILFPYIAAVFVFLVAKELVANFVYLVISVLFSLYFFPLRLIVRSSEKKWFVLLSSLLFAIILILTELYLINPDFIEIRTVLAVSAILCMLLLVYKHIFDKLDVRLFLLLLGFNILAGSCMVI